VRIPLRFPAFLILAAVQTAPAAQQGRPPQAPRGGVRDLDAPGRYRTPRAGEGFRTHLFGREIIVPKRDRRFVSAADIGLAATMPRAEENEILPFGSLYFWRHPDRYTLLRAVVVGVYNDIFCAKSSESLRPFEWVFGLESYTVPAERGDLIDGEILKEEKLYWGYVRPLLGFGIRSGVSPGGQDNMASADILFQPGLLYFARGKETGRNFKEPKDTFEGRINLRLRLDALERNLLELPHTGFALGGDLIYGWRSSWKDWGMRGAKRYHRAAPGRNYLICTAYALAATGVPFLRSERHRLVGALHAGIGDGVDRWSAPRVGGGPDPRGEEFGSTWRPVLPGAAIEEFYPKKYVVGKLLWRWEPLFFTYIEGGGALASLDRYRFRGSEVKRENDLLTALTFRVTTGFLWKSRLQLSYSYNFDVIRRGSRGGHALVVHISKSL